MRKLFLAAVLILFATPAYAGTGGCVVGAVLGGLLGSQIGSGNGQLAATAAGTLFGCAAGSNVQNSPGYQETGHYNHGHNHYGTPKYHPRTHLGNEHMDYNYGGPRVPYIPPTYYQGSQHGYSNQHYQEYYRPQPQVVIVQPAAFCREYTDIVVVGGRYVDAYGRACSYDGGRTWRLGPLTPVRY